MVGKPINFNVSVAQGNKNKNISLNGYIAAIPDLVRKLGIGRYKAAPCGQNIKDGSLRAFSKTAPIKRF